MIYYDTGPETLISRIFRCTGSVFPKSCAIALPVAIVAAILQVLFPRGDLTFFEESGGVLRETQAWSGFAFFVGFLIVFRTSQAYSRFWEGCTASHQMRAEWFDACSSIVSFTKYSQAPPEAVRRFKELLIRLTSMLHASALAELEKGEEDENAEGLWAHKYELIDPESLDSESLETIKVAEDRVELIFEWIQQLIVENIGTGVLSIPPPLLSRSFQELATGMVQFHNAMKIAYIPFPFPYAQTCDCLLVLHWMIVPIVTSQWVTNWVWAAIFSFMQVLILWSLNLIAIEIENPFGRDANDMDGARMQEEINRHLLMLMDPRTERTPRLSSTFEARMRDEPFKVSSFENVLKSSRRHSIGFMDVNGNVGGDDEPEGVLSFGASFSGLGGNSPPQSESGEMKINEEIADDERTTCPQCTAPLTCSTPREGWKCSSCTQTIQAGHEQRTCKDCSIAYCEACAPRAGADAYGSAFDCKQPSIVIRPRVPNVSPTVRLPALAAQRAAGVAAAADLDRAQGAGGAGGPEVRLPALAAQRAAGAAASTQEALGVRSGHTADV